jgi:sulfide dehydrogenase [flavocytochrome c] flavoprotein subunit
VANAVQAALAGKKKFPARYRNTCWSLIAPDDDVKVGASYTPGKDVLDAKDKFVSKTGEDAKVRNQNYQESLAWYAAITKDMFAT